ncbi:MAG TPA: SufD family Fe-S cluster assembly protein, partial [Acidimicrobiia bacterium]|nr:SufD family Fe-S cluster assembly protein [Acidimicrobiia bacterium]
MNFTPEVARARTGPGWLTERRQSAAERFASAALPTPSEEAWRYSRIEELNLDRYHPAEAPAAVEVDLSAASSPIAVGSASAAATVICVNGTVVSIDLDEGLQAKGVRVVDLTTLAEAPEALGRCADASPDAFLHLHDAFMAGGVFVFVPSGVFVEAPIVIEHRFEGGDSGDGGVASFPRTLVVVGEDGEASVLERFISSAGLHLVVPVTEIVVGDAARVSYLGLQDHAPSAWQIALQRSVVGKQATLRSSAVALGGDYARLRVEALLEGEGASSEMVAVYFANESQMLDFRTLQDHDAPHTNSELLFKGAVEDSARSVYSGLVRLRKTAQRANATQTNRNLVLSEGASAESIPNLEIEANDV